ncbi:hypothetical protein HG530_010147 [Fusarium avenaceum]|nr:hypothetical protein HG530_010147 [Fusarium avenaceum]
MSSTKKFEHLVDNSAGVAAGEHLTNNALGLFPLLNSQESPSHSLVCARLALLSANGVVNALSLVDLLLSGPAVNQSVGNIRGHSHTVASHVCKDWLGSSNLMRPPYRAEHIPSHGSKKRNGQAQRADLRHGSCPEPLQQLPYQRDPEWREYRQEALVKKNCIMLLHIGAGHREDVVAQIEFAITSSSRDQLGVGDVTRMSAGTSYVSETVQCFTETRTFTTMASLKIIGNQGRALEVGAVGVRVTEPVPRQPDQNQSMQRHTWLRNSGVLVVLISSDGSNLAHSLGTRLGLDRLGPMESLLIDATGDEALDKASRDQSILDVSSANTILVNDLLEELHGTLNLISNHVSVDDCRVHLGIKTVVKRRLSNIVSDSQVAVFVIAFNSTDQHISNASILGTSGDQLVISLGRVLGSIGINRCIKQLNGKVKTIVLAENGMLKLVRCKHKLARLIHTTKSYPLVLQSRLQLSNLETSGCQKTNKNVKSVSIWRNLPPEHISVDIERLGDDLDLLHGDVNSRQ